VVIEEYDLSDKLVTDTSDAGADIKKAIVTSNSLEWINCLAHLLNLVLKKVGDHERVGVFLKKVRCLLCVFKHSSRMMGQLKAKLKSMDAEKNAFQFEAVLADPNFEQDYFAVEPNLTIIKQDFDTRFNYVKIMVETVIKADEAIRRVINGDEHYQKDHGCLLLTGTEIGVTLILLSN
jgi:hypothetical protein